MDIAGTWISVIMDVYDAGRRMHVRARRNKKSRRLVDSICLNNECVGKALWTRINKICHRSSDPISWYLYGWSTFLFLQSAMEYLYYLLVHLCLSWGRSLSSIESYKYDIWYIFRKIHLCLPSHLWLDTHFFISFSFLFHIYISFFQFLYACIFLNLYKR